MKLNWFSPLPPAKTDIAHYTMRVLPSLAQRAEVTLWTDQREWDATVSDLVDVRSYRLERMPWVELNRADANIYHIGNNPVFHGAIWQTSRLQAGVVVLHDFRLHNFFDGLYRVQWRDLNSYLAVMEAYYGEQGRRDAAECFANEARNIAYMAEHYPLTELAAENALGVIVHTPGSYEELAKPARWPIAYLPLPFAAKRNAPERSGANGPPYRLIVFGYIGRNRRLDSVFNALAAMPEKEQFHLDVYGDILDTESEMRAQIRALGLKAQIALHGFAPENKLDEALAQAHLAINLRYPTMGEASGSQLRIWMHGLPSVVSRVGWYASLPKDAVLFARTDENEVADIQSHLRRLIAKPSALAEMGRRGRMELEARHAPDMYAEALVALAKRAREFRPRAATLKLADRAALLLSEWLTPEVIGKSGSNVARAILDLAGSSRSADTRYY